MPLDLVHAQEVPKPRRILGEHPDIQTIRKMILQVAHTESSVLITGSTGSGKELVAQEIHENSRRSHRGFCAINCTAITETLIENELFGHEVGAYTGASRSALGLFEKANGGTLLLDEIGDMTLNAQGKLLRVLETGKISRIGGNQEIPIDVRVLAATNRPLDELRHGIRFRSDLFYRLAVATLEMPPLQDHRTDIPLLVEHYLKVFHVKGIAPEVLEMFMNYHWPGNVRELKHVIEHGSIFADDREIRIKDLPRYLIHDTHSNSIISNAFGDLDRFLTLREFYVFTRELARSYVLSVLKKHGWNKAAASRQLGISYKHLLAMLKEKNDEDADIKKLE